MTAADRSAKAAMTRAVERREFADALAHAIESRGMSQRVLAKELGLSQSMVSAWVTGLKACHPRAIFRLEELLGLEPGELSRHMGYYPPTALGRNGKRQSLEDAIWTETDLDEDARRVLLAVLRTYKTSAAAEPAAAAKAAPARRAVKRSPATRAPAKRPAKKRAAAS